MGTTRKDTLSHITIKLKLVKTKCASVSRALLQLKGIVCKYAVAGGSFLLIVAGFLCNWFLEMTFGNASMLCVSVYCLCKWDVTEGYPELRLPMVL